MILALIYFLPCIVSLLWFSSFLLKKKDYKQKIFCTGEGLSVIFYAILGIYFFPTVDYDIMVKMEVVSLPIGVLTPTFLIAYLYVLLTGKHINERLLFLLFLPAIIMGVAVGLICFIIGFDNAAEVSRQFACTQGLTAPLNSSINQIYCFVTYNIFLLIEAVYILAALYLCFAILYHHGYRFGDVSRFFFRGKSTLRSRTIATMYILEMALMAVMMILGNVYIGRHMEIGISLTIALAATKHLIAYLEFYNDDNKPVTLYQLSHLTLSENSPAPCSDEEATDIHALTPAQMRMDKRSEQFTRLMEEQKIWKDPELTAQTICNQMGIGRTTLTAILTQLYDAPLRDVVNNYRIEEAKKFMETHPQATQEVTAQHCGFKNAQYFNTQFKKITGDTPAMWLASRNN